LRDRLADDGRRVWRCRLPNGRWRFSGEGSGFNRGGNGLWLADQGDLRGRRGRWWDERLVSGWRRRRRRRGRSEELRMFLDNLQLEVFGGNLIQRTGGDPRGGKAQFFRLGENLLVLQVELL
jgi:hypothetical protein